MTDKSVNPRPKNVFLSIEWNSIRLGGPAHGIVTRTVHKTLPGVVGAQGWVGIGLQGVVGTQVMGWVVG